MSQIKYLLLFVFLNYSGSFSQNPVIDSIYFVLSTTREDTTRIAALNLLAEKYSRSNPDTSIILANRALNLSQKIKDIKCSANSIQQIANAYFLLGKYDAALENNSKALKLRETINDKSGIAKSLGNIGSIYLTQADYNRALEYYLRSIKVAEEIGDKTRISITLGNIGIVYINKGDYPKALNNFFEALKIVEELGDKNEIAKHLVNIGSVYGYQRDFQKALNFFLKAVKMNEALGNLNSTAINLGNIGNIYNEKGDYPKALDYYFRALKISEEIGDKNGIARHLGNIGIVYENIGLYSMSAGIEKKKSMEQALDFYQKSLKLKEEIGDKNGMAIILGNIGKLNFNMGKFKDAEIFLNQSLELFAMIGGLEGIKKNELQLSQLYDTTGRVQLAFDHYKNFILARDSINSIENQKNQLRTEMNYDFEKKEIATRAEQDKKDAILSQERQKQRMLLFYSIGGIIVVIIFSGFLYRRYKITHQQKQIIEKQKKEVEEQKETILKQKDMVEEHQKEIIDSITYAKHLQNAILPKRTEILKNYPESFVLYKPKDIVAGDFYWMEVVNDTIYIAAADCTGHGVPGAMVSMVCSNALNRTVNEFGITDTGKILDKVRELVLDAFKKSDEEIKDGMDISLLSSKRKVKRVGLEIQAIEGPLQTHLEIQWSGANNPLWYFHGENLLEIKADKQPIGNYEDGKPFTTHTLSLPAGCTFYLFTDGFADQFGGTTQKKMTKSKFRELIIGAKNITMAQQSEFFEDFFMKWKGTGEQVDDVCVIGIRIN